MLSHLHIENYALIRHSDIDFSDGFVAITGETGAGKSILLGALALLLGGRADSKVLSDPQRKCVVEAHFDIRALDLQALFADNDVDYSDDGILLLRREILPSAKSRAFVNDTPVPLTFLKELGAQIIDIHSQHATLLLADSGFQTSLLDSLAGDDTLLREYRECYQRYTSLKRQLEQLTAEEQRNRKDLDYNTFLFEELQQANLRQGEQEELEEEASLLSNAESIRQTLSQVVELCDGSDDSALQRLNIARSLLGKSASFHKEIESLHSRLDSTLIELRDIVGSAESLGGEISYSPERQQEVEERLDLINRLEKKHNCSDISSLLDIQSRLEELIGQVNNSDRRIKEVMESVDKAFAALQKAGAKLSAAREKAACTLQSEIQPLFGDLGMPHAVLVAEVARSAEYGPTGNDTVRLLFNANKGGEPRDIGRVASGGEMSRLMLAIKSLTARATFLPTIIFDEIDSGISGDISVKVGRIMERMASAMQVIAITHLPQIAAHASQHFKVYKSYEGSHTASNIRLLDTDGRRRELAVMLSADPPTEAALQTACELMGL